MVCNGSIMVSFLVVVAVTLQLVAGNYVHKSRYDCGTCRDVVFAANDGDSDVCSRFGDYCTTFGLKLVSNTTIAQSRCDHYCQSTDINVGTPTPNANANAWGDLRVSIGYGGTKEYGTVRVSSITPVNDSTPVLTVNGAAADFQYSAPFKYKWTDNALHTTQLTGADKDPIHVAISGAEIDVKMPIEGAGVAGVLIGDPCLGYGSIISLVACFYAEKFNTTGHTSQLLNAFVGSSSETDFWGILGDNFYDRTGETTKTFFKELTLDTLAKPFLTVPGNHDYWVLGAPEVGSKEDQYSNGFMQYYAQDTKAAAESKDVPYNFSIDPSKGHPVFGGNLPVIENSFLYHQIGNVGIVGFSGAYTFEESRPLAMEACQWLGKKAASGTLKVAVLVGHWDTSGAGASTNMSVPHFYDEIKLLPGCDVIDKEGALKFFMGHTHCNVPHPHRHINTGFMVAGQGMEGCGNYGIPVIDTTENRLRIWHFQIANITGVDNYDTTMACLKEQGGWRQCTQHADSWLDQPLPSFD